MDLFEYIMIPPAIILGLAITHILGGLGKIVHRLAGHGESIRLNWIHLTWLAHIFIWIIFFWWFSYAWTNTFQWSLSVFIFLIFYCTVTYIMCVILIPSDLSKVSDFGPYFMSLRKWFFGGVILLILIDFVDTAIKGLDNILDLGAGYLSLRIFLFIASFVAMRTDSIKFHGPFALISFIWTFLFFWINRPILI
jgi:hypothetical protein